MALAIAITMLRGLASAPLDTDNQPRLLATTEQVFERMVLRNINDDWQCDFQQGPDTLQFDLPSIAYWGGHAHQVRAPVVQLHGTGRVIARVTGLDAEEVQVASEFWQAARLPRRNVAGILFSVDTDLAVRDRWLDRLEQTVETDRVWLTSGDFFEASIIGLSPQHSHLVVEDGGTTVQIEMSLIKAIVFTSNGTDHAMAAVANVSFIDGSVIPVNRIDAKSGSVICEHFSLSLSDKLDGRILWHFVCGLRPATSKNVMFLSEVKPANYRYVPYLHGHWGYQLNRSVVGTRIRSGSQQFDRGIGMHAKSSLSFALAQPAQRLDFELAIDPSAQRRGSVICRVFALKATDQWQTVYTSPVIRGGEPALLGSADLTGARAVALAVDFADGGDVLDRVNWIMPRLILP